MAIPAHLKKLEKWLGALDQGVPPAVVIGSSVNGLSFARSLGKRGIPVLMLDSQRSLGAHTRYALFLQLPSIKEQPGYWLEMLELLGKQLSTEGMLFPTSDSACQLLADHRAELQKFFHFVLADAQAISQIVNKRIQYEVARKIGVPIPQTHYPQSLSDLKALSQDIAYPCILKPCSSYPARKFMAGKKVAVAESAAELITEYEHLAGLGVELMLQEIVPGDDNTLFGYLGIWGHEGQELAWVTKQKFRQFPAQFGDGSLQVTVDAPKVAELSRKLLRAFNFSGYACVEFKWDERSQDFRLIECNPRTASGNQLATSAGVDFAWLGYQYLQGANPESQGTPATPGVKYVNEEWDFQAYLALRKSGDLGFVQWLRSIRGTRAWAVGALKDPLPLLIGLWRFLVTVPRRIKN